jgi:Streptomyces sporulation and cell division protein, SsgA
MGREAGEVRAALTLRLVVPRADVLLAATLRYDADDPYAVHLAFPPTETAQGVEWMFARQLLADGLVALTGDGDVRIWPSPEDPDGPSYIELCSPSGRAVFAAPHDALVTFLRRTVDLVPPGCESERYDVDAELDLLLHDDLS